MPLVQTLVAPRARMLVLAAAAAGSVFTLFTLVGVGAATGPLTSSFGTGESILEARYGGPERVAGPLPVAVRGGAGRTTKRAQGPRHSAKPATPLPGALRLPSGPAPPTVRAPAVPVLETPVPAATAPTLPALPAVPPPPAVPQVPELPPALTPAVPVVLP